MLSNYKRLSPEVAIASRSPAFAPGGPLSPLSPISPISSVFDRCVVSGVDGRTHGGLVRRSMEVPRDGNSGNDNAVVSSEANNGVDGVDPEANSPDSGGVEKSSAKPPRPGLQPILPCNAAARYASSTDFDLQFDKMSMITSPIGTSDEFLPIYRSGSWAERGPKCYMEDEHICIDNLVVHFNAPPTFPAPSSYYGVFDGHGGTDAAGFAKSSLLKFITGDKHFPHNMDKAIKNAFLKADHILADSDSLDQNSGTTVLTAFCFGRTLRIANAGDCRAVLGKRGRAVELSKDHKPTCKSEKARIEKLGGTIFDGYLNGQLAVSRALGDWHVKGSKTSLSPLSGEPELHELTLTAEDEFLIMGCDGLWDVMSSQCAVTMVRKELVAHNDPERCSKVLVTEALNRNSCDNLTVLVICFSPDPPPKIEVPRWRVRKSISMEGLHQIKGAMDASG